MPPANKLAVFCDFDGTLVPIAHSPDAVQLPPGMHPLLQSVQNRLDGAFALVTGRSLENLASFINIASFAAAGCHGAEWQSPPGFVIEQETGLAELIAPAYDAVMTFATRHGLLVEDKRFSLAVHFRDAPHLEAELDRFLLNHVDFTTGLKLVHGKCVREIKPHHIDKGTAIARFMHLPLFSGRVPLFVGDDATDEDGFGWVNQQRGISIKVGEGPTIAPYRLPGCDDVFQLLQAISQGGNYDAFE